MKYARAIAWQKAKVSLSMLFRDECRQVTSCFAVQVPSQHTTDRLHVSSTTRAHLLHTYQLQRSTRTEPPSPSWKLRLLW